ncbi:hypothetical protein Ga0123462_0742 [Mariprofundus ferrinatatus]|uniref:Uncharacterized protein n=1 Tax=Mariprofundus ferrinatatus TaxID=1921087 RepID=A0A2K8L3D4_9PROT|nr:hypothetical protein [Mariprofundus ferrinatatus]ATX81612.1 hypothetical protein Ga0123462_0742 [Mariprofundus ferrinatatus]
MSELCSGSADPYRMLHTLFVHADRMVDAALIEVYGDTLFSGFLEASERDHGLSCEWV